MRMLSDIRFNIRGFSIQAIDYHRFFLSLIFLVGTYVMFFANSLHEKYPDEFDNILGGWYILHGKLPYVGFFTHHGPVAYYIAAFILLFSGQSFVRFRIIYSILFFLFLLVSYLYLKRQIGNEKSKFYLFFIFIIGIAATYFWGHMLLADTVSGYILTIVWALLLLKEINRFSFTITDMWLVSVFCFIAELSSLTYTYFVIIIYFYVIIKFSKIFNKEYSLSNLTKVIGIMLVPFALFLIYLIMTGSMADYYYQGIVFNEKYYIYNYPRELGSSHINPFRFAVIIANNFYNGFYGNLVLVKNFDLNIPFNCSLALANLFMLIYFFSKRHYSLFSFFLFLLIYSAPRSDLLHSGETDYQAATYIILSLFNAAFLLSKIPSVIKEETDYYKKLGFSALFFIFSVYALATFGFIISKFNYKVYNKYMGKAPLIYDRPVIAHILNSVVNDDQYTWIGPFEFEELFYLNKKLPSKYQIFNPGMGDSTKISSEMLGDFQKNMPAILWFDKRFFILGRSPEEYGKPFIAFLSNNYTRLYYYRSPRGTRFISLVNTNSHIDLGIDLEKKLYIRKDLIEEFIPKLLNLGIIRQCQK